MLFISYLYKIVWELKIIWDNWITAAIEKFTKDQLLNDLNFVFDLSWIWEETFCKKINSFVKCLHKNEIDEIANFVQKRNHCAHPSWIIQYSESEVKNLISKIDTYTEKIQKKVNIQLLQYTKDNLDTISFNGDLILSESEVLFLLWEKNNILNFDSDSEENINKKVNFINLIYNEYTKNINFEESSVFELFIELLKWYNKDISLYNIIQKEFPLIIGGFSKKEIEEIVKILKKIKLEKDDEKSSIEFINNI